MLGVTYAQYTATKMPNDGMLHNIGVVNIHKMMEYCSMLSDINYSLSLFSALLSLISLIRTRI